MKESTASLAGALTGAAAWLLLRHLLPLPDLLSCVIGFCFFAVGLYGLVTGQLTMRGRHGRGPTIQLSPIESRLMSLAMVFCAFAFITGIPGVHIP
jgi:hypothetical protein